MRWLSGSSSRTFVVASSGKASIHSIAPINLELDAFEWEASERSRRRADAMRRTPCSSRWAGTSRSARRRCIGRRGTSRGSGFACFMCTSRRVSLRNLWIDWLATLVVISFSSSMYTGNWIDWSHVLPEFHLFVEQRLGLSGIHVAIRSYPYDYGIDCNWLNLLDTSSFPINLFSVGNEVFNSQNSS